MAKSDTLSPFFPELVEVGRNDVLSGQLPRQYIISPFLPVAVGGIEECKLHKNDFANKFRRIQYPCPTRDYSNPGRGIMESGGYKKENCGLWMVALNKGASVVGAGSARFRIRRFIR